MHSYRNLQIARVSPRILPGQAELSAIRFVVLMALLGCLLGVLVWPGASLWSNRPGDIGSLLAAAAVGWLAGSILSAALRLKDRARR